MNEISIIINDVRYDAVKQLVQSCNNCDLHKLCNGQNLTDLCLYEDELFVFKKSTKGLNNWVKLERDNDGFLIGDVSDLAQFLPFLILEDMSKFDLYDNVHIVDEGNFGEWASDIDTKPRYSHIMPNVELIKR